MPFQVYYLRCPHTQTIKYVGTTSRATYARRAEHVSNPARKMGRNLEAWLVSIEPNRPTIETQCIVESREEALRIESSLIDLLRSRGVDLVNGIEEERRDRIRATNLATRDAAWHQKNGERVRAALAKLPVEKRCGAARTPEGIAAHNAAYTDPLRIKIRNIINKVK